MKNTVFLLGVGDELLDGRVNNTNANFFATHLTQNGLKVVEVRAVADSIAIIGKALHEAARLADTVIVTGGLGPTSDDLTAEAAAKAFGKKYVESAEARKQIKAMLQLRGTNPTPARLGMARVPAGAKIMRNDHGVAPAFHCRHDNCDYFFLQGVPRECRPIFLEQILPRLKKQARGQGRRHYNIWRTFGRKEADIHLALKPLIQRFEKKYPDAVRFGFQIPWPCVDVRFEVWQAKKMPTAREISDICRSISEALQEWTFSRKDESMAEAVMQRLRLHKKTLATAESCTGGLVGKMLTDIPGSSENYLGGAVTYANSAKQVFAAVSHGSIRRHGAVSRQVAAEMALGIRDALSADLAVSLTGISGPSGGTKDKPVGTIYIGLADHEKVTCQHKVNLSAQGARHQNREYAAHLALDMIRRHLDNLTV